MERKAQLIAWLAESPKDNFLKYALATEFVAEGNDDKAGELFQQLITEEPNYYATYYHYGQLLEPVPNLLEGW